MVVAHAETLVEHFSSNLREARARRGLTQDALARLSGVPRSTISNVESGEGNPTLHVVSALAEALRLSIDELLSPPWKGSEVFRAADIPVKRRGAAVVQKLLPHTIPGMEIDRITLARGARLTGTPHRAGTHEYLYCECGQLVLHVAGESITLGPGDLDAFPGDQRHSYRNPDNATAVGFSVVTMAG